MLRVNDIIQVLKSSRNPTDFWLLTSGLNLSRENAKRLKKAGLTGVLVSLDHHEESAHNDFRKTKDSFAWAHEAVRNAIEADILTGLTICPTREYVSSGNMERYMKLAKEWGVAFVQILEPKPVGHYKDKDVILRAKEVKILDDIFLTMNFRSYYADYPVISYHGYYQRRVGCLAGANRNVYVDTDGDLHACPFCQSKTGNALSDNFAASLQKVKENGCHTFKNATI
jgi:MoaA/NifB/PqqE/SkfB family radical SAM enzyme